MTVRYGIGIRHILIHTLVWLVLFVLMGNAMTYPKDISDFDLILGRWKWVDLTGTCFNALIFYTVSLLLAPRFFHKKRLHWFFACLFGLWFVAGWFEMEADSRWIPDLWEYFAVKEYLSALVFKLIVFSGLGLAYNLLVKGWRSQRMAREMREEQLDMELRFLKAQISPHFLFNTLNNIYGEAMELGADPIAHKIARLSGLMRYMLYETEASEVALEKEINCIEGLIELNQLRVDKEDSLVVDFKVEGSTKGRYIAPMILVPFVENAFKHGYQFSEHSPIHVHIKVSEGRIDFETKNRLFDMRASVDGNSGLGLENIHKRLELIYPDRHNLAIDEEAGYFSVKLTIKDG